MTNSTNTPSEVCSSLDSLRGTGVCSDLTLSVRVLIFIVTIENDRVSYQLILKPQNLVQTPKSGLTVSDRLHL